MRQVRHIHFCTPRTWESTLEGNMLPQEQRSCRLMRWYRLSFQCRGVPLIWILAGQGTTAPLGAGGVAFGHF